MKGSSRIRGFYKLSIEERRREVAKRVGISHEEEGALDWGGLLPADADNLIENVLGTFRFPFAVCPNFLINGEDRLVPMVVEEPSVVAAASNAARIVREGGGFTADADEPRMIAQIQIENVGDFGAAKGRVEAAREEILALADECHPCLVNRGGGARDLRVRPLEGAPDQVVVHVVVDCRNAMGANLLNTVAERVGGRLAEIAGGTLGLRILSNLSDERCVRVSCRVPAHALAIANVPGERVRDQIIHASRFAESDPYRAATHNKGIMNGVDAVALASGNDWRSVEAGAHAFAARGGRYAPLAIWRAEDDGFLSGRMEIPMAVGTVGGSIRVHKLANLALRIMQVETATDLAKIMACAGLASNMAALRALATIGIQRGHMSLHARSVARAAGARDGKVELVAHLLAQSGEIRLEKAESILRELGLD